jgi:hypothetical protein
MSTELVEHSPDARLARAAARQHGVISRAQLRDLGIADHAIAYRLRTGRLHRVRRGVFAVGHPRLTPRGRWMAAVLACGPGAALGYVSAAALWEIRNSSATGISVVVPTAGGRRQPGLRVYRHPGLRPDELTTRDGIPVTTLARTVLDLAAVLNDADLERALDQCEFQRLLDWSALDALARAHPRHRGARILAKTLATYEPGTTRTKSDLEKLFIAICEAHGLPRPLVNHRTDHYEVDFLFPDHRLIVEADSWTYHRTRLRFERDRRRDATHARAGFRTLRFTDRQLEHDAEGVAATIRTVLAA